MKGKQRKVTPKEKEQPRTAPTHGSWRSPTPCTTSSSPAPSPSAVRPPAPSASPSTVTPSPSPSLGSTTGYDGCCCCCCCLLSLFVGCLTSQPHARVFQERISSDNWTCCHTGIEVADPTFCLTQKQYTDIGPTSPPASTKAQGAWQGSLWSTSVEVTGVTQPEKNPWRRLELNPGLRSRGGRLNHLTWGRCHGG